MEKQGELEIELEQIWEYHSKNPTLEGLLVSIGETHYDVRFNGKTVENRKYLETLPPVKSLLNIAKAILIHYRTLPGRNRTAGESYPLYIKVTRKGDEIVSEVKW